jgi:hypothetical protein
LPPEYQGDADALLALKHIYPMVYREKCQVPACPWQTIVPENRFLGKKIGRALAFSLERIITKHYHLS